MMLSCRWPMHKNKPTRTPLPCAIFSLYLSNFRGVSDWVCVINDDSSHSVLYLTTLDQSSELAQALKRSQTELADARQECQSLRTEHAQTETKLLEASQLMDEVVCLKQELSEKEKKIEEICAERMAC